MPTHASQPASVRDGIFGDVLGGLANAAIGTQIPVLYLPGNNDTLGVNADFHSLNDYCPFTEDGQTVLTAASHPWASPVLNGQADIIDESHLADGYYAARIPMGASRSPLRVLALNTNIFTSAYLLWSLKSCHPDVDSVLRQRPAECPPVVQPSVAREDLRPTGP